MLKLFILISIVSITSGYSQATEERQYLGVLQLTEYYQVDSNWTEADSKIVSEHFMRLQKLAADGIIILAGRTDLAGDDPEMMGLVIINTTTREEAEKIMFEDPAVVGKIMTAKLLPFDVAVMGTQ